MRQLDLKRVRRALIVAPHSDDETIGAYGLILRLLANRTDVRILIVTDGTASHRNSLRWPGHRLADERRRESRRVLRRIGVAAGAIRFLGLPDGGLRTITCGQKRLLINAILQSRSDLLVLPHIDDDHPDHRVVARLAARASLGSRRISYLVWPRRGARPTAAFRRLQVPGGPVAKRWAISGYLTQTGLIRDDPDGFAIDDRLRARFARPMELFEFIR